MNVSKIKGLMAEKGYTQKRLAEELGVTQKTLSNKFQKGIFKSDEMKKMILVLGITNPTEIFFGDVVTQRETFKGGGNERTNSYQL